MRSAGILLRSPGAKHGNVCLGNKLTDRIFDSARTPPLGSRETLGAGRPPEPAPGGHMGPVREIRRSQAVFRPPPAQTSGLCGAARTPGRSSVARRSGCRACRPARQRLPGRSCSCTATARCCHTSCTVTPRPGRDLLADSWKCNLFSVNCKSGHRML